MWEYKKVQNLPLPTLLSQVLVAFTIEFDNEAEHLAPHRTTNHGGSAESPHALWLVSMVMWFNCMKYVGEEGVTVSELERLARTGTNLPGMKRWGYITFESDTTNSHSKRPRPDAVIRATRAGRKAQEIWQPLFGIIEERWRERFGHEEIDHLRGALWGVARQFDVDLPDCLPILGYGLYSRESHYERLVLAGDEDSIGAQLPLPALLSRVLLAFAIDFERESDLSLAISANVMRVSGEKGVKVRDLPLLTGVSKESIAMSLSFLEKHGYAEVEPESPGSRVKVLVLTQKGRKAQDTYRRLIWEIEERWQVRFGESIISALREALERLAGEPQRQKSPLFRGLDPYPDGWRASVREPDTLPHYPMVLHRGGFPDGS